MPKKLEKTRPVRHYKKAKYPDYNAPNPLFESQAYPFPLSIKFLRWCLAGGLSMALQSEAISQNTEIDTMYNPFPLAQTYQQLPFSNVMFGTGMPIRMQSWEVQHAIKSAFAAEGLDTTSYIWQGKNGKVVLDPFDEKTGIGNLNIKALNHQNWYNLGFMLPNNYLQICEERNIEPIQLSIESSWEYLGRMDLGILDRIERDDPIENRYQTLIENTSLNVQPTKIQRYDFWIYLHFLSPRVRGQLSEIFNKEAHVAFLSDSITEKEQFIEKIKFLQHYGLSPLQASFNTRTHPLQLKIFEKAYKYAGKRMTTKRHQNMIFLLNLAYDLEYDNYPNSKTFAFPYNNLSKKEVKHLLKQKFTTERLKHIKTIVDDFDKKNLTELELRELEQLIKEQKLSVFIHPDASGYSIITPQNLPFEVDLNKQIKDLETNEKHFEDHTDEYFDKVRELHQQLFKYQGEKTSKSLENVVRTYIRWAKQQGQY